LCKIIDNIISLYEADDVLLLGTARQEKIYRVEVEYLSFSGISMEIISDLLWRKVAIGTLKKLSIHMFTRYEHAPAT